MTRVQAGGVGAKIGQVLCQPASNRCSGNKKGNHGFATYSFIAVRHASLHYSIC